MPKSRIESEFDLTTRNSITKVGAKVSISLDGRELPNTGVIGEALDAACELIQAKITESYKVVPPRPVGTEIKEVYPRAATPSSVAPTEPPKPAKPPEPAEALAPITELLKEPSKPEVTEPDFPTESDVEIPFGS